MHPILLLALLALAACSRGGEERSEGGKGAPAAPVFRPDGQLASLTGLYESGNRQARNQLCIVEGKGETRFAFVVHGKGERSCSGGGSLERSGTRLRLTLSGEQPCSVDAMLSGREIAISGPVPSTCSYYCTSGMSLSGTHFTLNGASIEDARRARDLVGEPLCEAR
ncbi:MAG TPA: hypothetical protein VI381_01945 [Allosphingosinicella sp.]